MAQLQAQLEVTLARVRTAQNQLDGIVGQYETAEHRLTEIHEQITQTDNQQKAIEAELRAAKAAINRRAASIYRSEGVGLINVVLSARTYRQFLTAYRLVQSVARRDSENLGRVSTLKAETERLRTEQEAQRQAEQGALTELGKQQKQVKSALQAVGREYDLVRAELEKRKSGFAFPVKAPYSYTDSWGAPRMEGTSYYHRHEGTDIFALAGTPVVSVVDGVIEKLGTASLGG
ncbi:MAG TPA: hypothetical protein VND22_00320, partial [Actinomycetota bacterium]|nr:hypothetical protein [Actinomycetota bacterium]